MAGELHISRPQDGRCAARATDERIAAQATSRLGVITRRKLVALGLSDDAVDSRLARGLLRPSRYEGVFLLGHGAEVPGQREALALAACGPGALLAGRSAGGWRGMHDRWSGDVEVLVPMGRHRPIDGIMRRTARVAPDDVSSWRGLPCVTPERAAMDLPPALLRQALQWLMKHGRAVEPLVERMHGRRGARAFRAEVAQLVPQMAHTMSELEDRFLRLCRRYGLPLPRVNVVSATGGDLLDCTWPGRKLVVELDGRRWHEHRDREDRARDRRRQLEGLAPFRYGWWDVTRDEERTAAEVTRGLAL